MGKGVSDATRLNRCYRARSGAGLSRRELARRINENHAYCTETILSNIENPKINQEPSREVAYGIAKECNDPLYANHYCTKYCPLSELTCQKIEKTGIDKPVGLIQAKHRDYLEAIVGICEIFEDDEVDDWEMDDLLRYQQVVRRHNRLSAQLDISIQEKIDAKLAQDVTGDCEEIMHHRHTGG